RAAPRERSEPALQSVAPDVQGIGIIKQQKAAACCLVDDHFISDIRHRIQPLDIRIAKPYAAVRDAAAQFVRLVGAVNPVAIAQLEAVLAKDAGELPLGAVDGRNDDRAS